MTSSLARLPSIFDFADIIAVVPWEPSVPSSETGTNISMASFRAHDPFDDARLSEKASIYGDVATSLKFGLCSVLFWVCFGEDLMIVEMGATLSFLLAIP
jgi:hypothetical protein